MAPLPPKNFGLALYPGFEPTDFLHTMIMLTALEKTGNLVQVALLAHTAARVSPQPAKHSLAGLPRGPVEPTHTFDLAPHDLEVLIVPGGIGAVTPRSEPVVDFIAERYPRLRHVLTVCSGSFLAAQAGILEGKEATTGETFYNHVSGKETGVKWKREGRCVDGNVWTASRGPTGVDQTFAFIADQFGEEVARRVEQDTGYEWNKKSEFVDMQEEIAQEQAAELAAEYS